MIVSIREPAAVGVGVVGYFAFAVVGVGYGFLLYVGAAAGYQQALGWAVKDGIMVNQAGTNNLVSDQKFWNFKLHAEFRIGKGSNGGFGLRGRYEIQIVDDFAKRRTPTAQERCTAASSRRKMRAKRRANGMFTTLL